MIPLVSDFYLILCIIIALSFFFFFLCRVIFLYEPWKVLFNFVLFWWWWCSVKPLIIITPCIHLSWICIEISLVSRLSVAFLLFSALVILPSPKPFFSCLLLKLSSHWFLKYFFFPTAILKLIELLMLLYSDLATNNF